MDDRLGKIEGKLDQILTLLINQQSQNQSKMLQMQYLEELKTFESDEDDKTSMKLNISANRSALS